MHNLLIQSREVGWARSTDTLQMLIKYMSLRETGFPIPLGARLCLATTELASRQCQERLAASRP